MDNKDGGYERDCNQHITRINKIPPPPPKKKKNDNNLVTGNNIRKFPTKKKKIIIAGCSIIKNITATAISKDHTVNITSNLEATNIDIFHYIKPELHYQPDLIILHCGTNNIAMRQTHERN